MVSSPNMEANSQLLSLNKPLKYGDCHWIWSWLFYLTNCLAFGSIQLSTQVPSFTSKKVFPYRYPCHTWELGLGIMCEVLSPNFHALNGWDCTDYPQTPFCTCHKQSKRRIEYEIDIVCRKKAKMKESPSHGKMKYNIYTYIEGKKQPLKEWFPRSLSISHIPKIWANNVVFHKI